MTRWKTKIMAKEKGKIGGERNDTTFRKLRHLIGMVLDQESCWLWRGSVTDDGHPKWRVNNTTGVVSKIVWSFAYKRRKPQSNRYMLLRSCDNLLCCRPSHLFKDSTADVLRTNVRSKNLHLNLRTPHKITREDAMRIRFSTKDVNQLAREFNLSLSGVYAIKSRRYWK